MKCGNCQRDIDRPYHSRGVQAVEQVMITNPDGSGQTWTPKAIVACGWSCLAVLVDEVAPLYEPVQVDDNGNLPGGLLFTRRPTPNPDEEPF